MEEQILEKLSSSWQEIWKTQDVVAIASSGVVGWGEGPYRSEIVVEVRCEISPSTGGIFTNRGLER